MRKVGNEPYVRGMGKSYIFVREAICKDHLENNYQDNIKAILKKKVRCLGWIELAQDIIEWCDNEYSDKLKSAVKKMNS